MEAILSYNSESISPFASAPLYGAYEPDAGYAEAYRLSMDELRNNGTYGLTDYSICRQDFAMIHEDLNCETRLWPFIPRDFPNMFQARESNGQRFVTSLSRKALATLWLEVWDKAIALQATTRL
jgi:hypothetical protein